MAMVTRFTRLLNILVLGGSLLFSAPGAYAQGMSLQETWRQTYMNNPSLKAARAELRAVEEELPQAHAGWRPTVMSSAELLSSDSDASNFGGSDGSVSKALELTFDQPLYRGGRTRAQIRGAEHTIQAQLARVQQHEQDLLLEATTVYMDVLRDQAHLDLGLSTQKVIAKQLEATQDRFEVGELTITDVSQARARLAKAEADVITVTGDLNASRAMFEEVVGVPSGVLVPPLLLPPIPEDLDVLIAQAEEHNLDILAAIHTHKAAEEDVGDVFGELLPEVGAFGSVNKTYDPQPGLLDDQMTKSVGVSATIPLYQAGSVRSRVRGAKHTANQKYMEVMEVQRRVKQDIVSHWNDWQAAQAEIKSRNAQVNASRIAQEGVHYETEFGTRTVLDALDADQELLDAQVALVTAQRNEVIARFSLLAALGRLTPEALGFVEDKIAYE